MTQNNITDIEKCARLIGYDHAGVKNIDGDLAVIKTKRQVNATWFNPRTNKADLVDVETELSIDTRWNKGFVMASTRAECWYESFKHHPTKFAARAEAVMSVVSQLYDAKFGKDGE